MAELIDEARSVNPELDAVTVLNAADAQGRDNEEAATALGEVNGLRYLPQMIGRRKAFPNAASAGRCVVEQKPEDAKAVADISALADVAFA